MAGYSKLDASIKKFLVEKGEKLSNKRALLYYLKLPDNYHEFLQNEKNSEKLIKKIDRTIDQLEIEFELSMLNDKHGGGRLAYFNKFKEQNVLKNDIINVELSIKDDELLKEVENNE